jgi:hypothetical protein
MYNLPGETSQGKSDKLLSGDEFGAELRGIYARFPFSSSGWCGCSNMAKRSCSCVEVLHTVFRLFHNSSLIHSTRLNTFDERQSRTSPKGPYIFYLSLPFLGVLYLGTLAACLLYSCCYDD